MVDVVTINGSFKKLHDSRLVEIVDRLFFIGHPFFGGSIGFDNMR